MTERFAERLKALRERRRISRSTLSELCGLSRNMVSRYELGDSQPSIEAAAQLAEYLGVSMDYLCGLEDG